MKLSFKFTAAALLAGLASLTSCNKNDNNVTFQNITVAFAVGQMGFDDGDSSVPVGVTLSRKADRPVTVEIAFGTDGGGSTSGSGAAYGTQFTTAPAATVATGEGKLTLAIPAGSTTASFSVTKTPGATFTGSESVVFSISSLSDNSLKIGGQSTMWLSFGPILSEGGLMTLEGNGSENIINSVYVDLSGNRQTDVNRKSWDLGFWCGADFRVVLNGACETVATPSATSDINAADLAQQAAALPDSLNLDISPMLVLAVGKTYSTTLFDDPHGSLAGTAFSEVAADSASNKVYFVASTPQKITGDRGEWYKVRVTRSGDGYRVQFGTVGGASGGGGAVKTIDVSKRAGYNFSFLSLESGQTVDVEPQAPLWDIKWSYDTGYSTSLTFSPPPIFFMQDIVSINNLGGVSVATVMTSTVSYANFGVSNLAALPSGAFDTARDAIGDGWRAISSPFLNPSTPSPGVRTDRFYVIKDPAGNCYKLRFTRMGLNNDGAERGRPQIEYALVE